MDMNGEGISYDGGPEWYEVPEVEDLGLNNCINSCMINSVSLDLEGLYSCQENLVRVPDPTRGILTRYGKKNAI
jgi:hypothetical protein